MLRIRPATAQDMDGLEAIRAAAFAPVFASFRAILGDTIYEVAQRHEDEAQTALLASLLEDPAWELYVAEADGELAGFVSVRLDHQRKVGEIGLNAVHPAKGSRGFGTQMYEFALERMEDAGMKVATVATGADPSHAAARRAYEKAGFDVEIPSVWMCRELARSER